MARGDAPDVPRAGAAAAAPGPRDGGDLLRAGVLERVPARAAVHPGRRPQDDPHRAAGVLEPLRDRLLAAVLRAVDRDPADDRHLRRVQPADRGGHHGRVREVGSGRRAAPARLSSGPAPSRAPRRCDRRHPRQGRCPS